MKLGLIWGGVVLLGGLLASGEIGMAIEAALAVAGVVWLIQRSV